MLGVGCTPRVAAGVVGLGCFADRRCSAAAWRTDHRAVRVLRPTPLGLREETAESVLWSQRHLLAAVGRCEWVLHCTGVVMAPRRGSCDGSDAAARHVAGSEVWLQWTMSSTNVKLNGFPWNYVGGRAAVDERLQRDDGGVCFGCRFLRRRHTASC
ncbi:putative retrotransposon hot spot protein (RHS) [Trypanosoma cruzi]|uniref:Putative retrotransposon hot spot protein (RHS) n=1 Tax=Trypanosoma cruzi TaxID=5693 RepID=A0A2V2W0Z9_TRYCR|nr:putative retrotransposon hot spot protein (RHS) [Trypanosoma cruzi]RNC34194.1 retrotransposon hot spot (RHS) protein [Trypanosoma cruzi]